MTLAIDYDPTNTRSQKTLQQAIDAVAMARISVVEAAQARFDLMKEDAYVGYADDCIRLLQVSKSLTRCISQIERTIT